MAASSTISSKGQITVPIEVRRRLGVKQGDRVEFVHEDGPTILRPAQGPGNPFDEFVGALHTSKISKRSTPRSVRRAISTGSTSEDGS